MARICEAKGEGGEGDRALARGSSPSVLSPGFCGALWTQRPVNSGCPVASLSSAHPIPGQCRHPGNMGGTKQAWWCRAADPRGKCDNGQGQKGTCVYMQRAIVGWERNGHRQGPPPGLPDALMGNLCFGCTTYGGGLDSRSRDNTECPYLH